MDWTPHACFDRFRQPKKGTGPENLERPNLTARFQGTKQERAIFTLFARVSNAQKWRFPSCLPTLQKQNFPLPQPSNACVLNKPSFTNLFFKVQAWIADPARRHCGNQLVSSPLIVPVWFSVYKTTEVPEKYVFRSSSSWFGWCRTL